MYLEILNLFWLLWLVIFFRKMKITNKNVECRWIVMVNDFFFRKMKITNENGEFLKVRIKYAYEYYKKKVRIRTWTRTHTNSYSYCTKYACSLLSLPFHYPFELRMNYPLVIWITFISRPSWDWPIDVTEIKSFWAARSSIYELS